MDVKEKVGAALATWSVANFHDFDKKEKLTGIRGLVDFLCDMSLKDSIPTACHYICASISS